MLDDLKHYKADRLGSFRLISEEVAGAVAFVGLIVLMAFAPVMR